MEQSGEPPQPEPADPTPTEPRPNERPERRAFVIVSVLTGVLIAAVLSWMINRHDGRDALTRDEERFPSPTTTVAAATGAPTTTAAAALPDATTGAPASVPTPPPTGGISAAPGATSTTADTGSDYIAQLVPNVAAFAQYLSTPQDARAQIDKLLASGRHDVATPGPALSICAAVRMGQPLAVKSRWERDGRRIASSDLGRRDAPGFGECLGNEGAPLVAGSYQYIAIDSEGHESAAGGIVIGADRVAQPFTNDGSEPVCLIRIAPSASRYFEVYVYTAQPITTGRQVTIPVAAVRQDVETVGCEAGADDVLAKFSFDPNPAKVQTLR